MKPNHSFPIRLYFWAFLRQTVYLVVVFLPASYLFWWWLNNVTLSPWSFYVLAVTFGLGLSLIINAVLLRHLLIPLGRLIDKTRRLREVPFDEESEQLELGEDDPGEWFELDRALNQLGQSLREKTIQLSREKTELRAIMSSISEAVLAVSNARQVLFYNAQFAHILGIKAGVVDEKISSLFRQPDVLDAYDRTLKKGQGVRMEVSLPPKDGGENRQYILSVSPLKKQHNQEIYGAVGLFYDVTQLKRAEQVRIEFVGNVSHELRTPLTSISGYLQTVIQDVDKQRFEDAKEFLRVIEKNVNRLKNLVVDLLDLSNLESGQDLRMEWHSTEELTEAVLKQIGGRREIKAEFLEPQVYGDFDRIAQVLRNLLENAIRYVPAEKDIRVRWFSGSDRAVLLKVIDDGPGIAPEHQPRLFERFYRVDQSRARVDGGTGIGLSLVKHIMSRHAGWVEVQSQIGKGAEFTCSFPSPSPTAS